MDKERLVKMTDEILQRVFELIMFRNDKIFDFLESAETLFGSRMREIDRTNLVYAVSVPRKNYHYPQREISQYFQLYGRTPAKQDIDMLQKIVKRDGRAYDSVLGTVQK